MSGNDSPSFIVECPECDVVHESGGFEETSDFVDKHNEHTDHEMHWVRADFDTELQVMDEWKLECTTCNQSWTFESKDRAQSFREEHSEYTDHQISTAPQNQTVEPKIEGAEISNSNSIRRLVAQLEEYYDDAVPKNAVFAHIGDNPNKLAHARHELENLRKKGEIYEPELGKIRTT